MRGENKSFNTTLVTVLLQEFMQLRSFHHGFNTTLVTVLCMQYKEKEAAGSKFQYNSCYCSIKAFPFHLSYSVRFNTTLVTVLLFLSL